MAVAETKRFIFSHRDHRLNFAIDAVIFFQGLHSTATYFRCVRVTEQWQSKLFYDACPTTLRGRLCCYYFNLSRVIQSKKYIFFPSPRQNRSARFLDLYTTVHPACTDAHPLSVSQPQSWHNPQWRGKDSLRRQRRPSQPKPPRPKRTCTSRSQTTSSRAATSSAASTAA